MPYPKLVLRASIKVGNEEKFFVLLASLLNLADGCLCSAMHTSCYSGEVNFGLSSEMRNSSDVTFVDCFIMHRALFIEVLQCFTYQPYKRRGQGKNKKKTGVLNIGSVRFDL
jgi:glycosylphosphatidylinositol transamidase (GPIT) subunit GPI8